MIGIGNENSKLFIQQHMEKVSSLFCFVFSFLFCFVFLMIWDIGFKWDKLQITPASVCSINTFVLRLPKIWSWPQPFLCHSPIPSPLLSNSSTCYRRPLFMTPTPPPLTQATSCDHTANHQERLTWTLKSWAQSRHGNAHPKSDHVQIYYIYWKKQKRWKELPLIVVHKNIHHLLQTDTGWI